MLEQNERKRDYLLRYQRARKRKNEADEELDEITMKDDVISRQAAIALAKDICVPTKDGTVYKHRCIDPNAIRDLPSAQSEPCEDFVKVVRCKKCRYVHCDKEFDNYWCNRMSGAFMVEAEGFCKWGR